MKTSPNVEYYFDKYQDGHMRIGKKELQKLLCEIESDAVSALMIRIDSPSSIAAKKYVEKKFSEIFDSSKEYHRSCLTDFLAGWFSFREMK